MAEMEGGGVPEKALSGVSEGGSAPVSTGSSAGGRESGGGNGTGAGTWTSQLSKELRDDEAALKEISGFSTISDLVSAYLGRAKGAVQEAAASTGLEGQLAAQSAAAVPDTAALQEQYKQVSMKLISEFGEAARDFYGKATRLNGVGDMLEKAQLTGNYDIARALCLLGREMSEESTPAGSQAVFSNNSNDLSIL